MLLLHYVLLNVAPTTFQIVAIDSANNTGRANINVKILDMNDWTPTFLNDTFFLNVTEGRPSLNKFVQLPVADYDDGELRTLSIFPVEIKLRRTRR